MPENDKNGTKLAEKIQNKTSCWILDFVPWDCYVGIVYYMYET